MRATHIACFIAIQEFSPVCEMTVTILSGYNFGHKDWIAHSDNCIHGMCSTALYTWDQS